LTEITHREPKLSSRHVEDLYALLEEHGDDAMRAAIRQAVRSNKCTVAAVSRSLSNSSAQRAQPRGHDRQLELTPVRAEQKGGDS
jgi:hypothetical protein